MNKDERKKLSRFLKAGDKSKIAEKCGVSPQTVSRYINGQSASSSCEGYFMATKRKQEAEQSMQEM